MTIPQPFVAENWPNGYPCNPSTHILLSMQVPPAKLSFSEMTLPGMAVANHQNMLVEDKSHQNLQKGYPVPLKMTSSHFTLL